MILFFRSDSECMIFFVTGRSKICFPLFPRVFLMSSHVLVTYLQELHEWQSDPLFLEFLQQLFPWVSPVADPSSQGFRQIWWATDEIGRALFAIHNHDEGFVRLNRGPSDRPRSSWSQLLHGQNSATHLSTKLINFILDLFNFARPNRVITGYQCSNSLHRSGVYNGSWVLQHQDSTGAAHGNATGVATASTATSPPPILEETTVFLQVESPDGQDHLPTTERDVIIRIRVAPGRPSSQQQELGGNDMACLSSLSYDSELQASVHVQNTSVPLTRQNAMSFRSDNFIESDCASDTSSPTHLERDFDSDEAEEEEEVPTLHSCISNSKTHSFDVNTEFDKVKAPQQIIPTGTMQATCDVNGLHISLLDNCLINNPKVIITRDCGTDFPGLKPQVGYLPAL
jgi:hypothetical protein